MRIFYSRSAANGAGGFFHEDAHGMRNILVPDPDWKPGVGGELHPLIEAPNPETKIPEDALEVSQEAYDALFAAQSSGKVIVPGDDGHPSLIDQPGPSAEQQLKNMRVERDRALTASDWTQMADSPLAPSTKAAWAAYRLALRDYPAAKPGTPWPVAPGA